MERASRREASGECNLVNQMRLARRENTIAGLAPQPHAIQRSAM
jgi:hypothetical protein